MKKLKPIVTIAALFSIMSLFVIVIVPTLTIPESFAEGQIPDWVKNNFSWYADDIISEGELLDALKFLIEQQIILVDLESLDIPDRSKFTVGGAVFKSGWLAADYTIMVYVVGSDLESKYKLATADFAEMVEGNPGDNINVIITTGGSKATPSGDRTIDYTTVKRHHVTSDGIEELEDLGELNMGDSETLSDFIVWGVDSYPAEKYAIVLWNHGNGINGYGIDEINRDVMDLDELQEAFRSANAKSNAYFEVIGFDACLMATLEVANVLKDYGNYMVASEEFEVGYGWEYKTVISSITENPTQTGDELGKVIADSFFADTVAKSKPGQDLSRITTLSVVDLKKISSLNGSVNTLYSFIEKNISEDDMPKFSFSLNEAERYGIVKGKDSGHMDIKNFVQKIPKHLPEFTSYAEEVVEDVDDAVVYAVQGASRPNANGLSLYMPLTSDAVETNYRYGNVASTNMFYADYLNRDTTAPTQNLKSDGTTITGTYKGNDIYELIVYFTTGMDESGIVKIISTDEFDPNDTRWGFSYGQVNYSWDVDMPSICNAEKCIPAFVEWVWGDTVSLGYIPVIIENEQGRTEADLMYDISNVENEVFIGAYPNTENGIFEKNLLTLEPGDKIYPYIEINHFNSGTSMLVPEESHFIIVDETTFTKEFWQKYNGPFYLNVAVCDYSDNCSRSDFFRYDVEGQYDVFK